jgi:hypothetical protein
MDMGSSKGGPLFGMTPVANPASASAAKHPSADASRLC